MRQTQRRNLAGLALALMVLAACAPTAVAPSATTVPAATRDCSATPDPNAVVDWCTRWRSVGYEFHITRSADWSDTKDKPIAQAAWEAFARSDARLIEDGYVDWADTGRAIGFDWRDVAGPSLVWRDGQVNVKGVRTQAEIGEIVAFARGLGASLQGDDGETYKDDGRPA